MLMLESPLAARANCCPGKAKPIVDPADAHRYDFEKQKPPGGWLQMSLKIKRCQIVV
jgi:hypothetical protein